MKTNEEIKATGSLVVTLLDADGNVKAIRSINNLVVTVGKNFIASRMTGTGSAVMSHMAIGTGATAAALGDTALGAEVARLALSSGNAAGDTVTYVGVFGAGAGTGAITEAGIFNAGAAGTMLARTVFPVVNKGADDSISISWTVKLT